MIYEVYVRHLDEYYQQDRCDWLGHHSYRCGNPKCKKGYFKVRTEEDFDKECPQCKRVVVVRRSPSEW